MVMAVLRQCICRQRSSRHEFLLRQWQCVKKSLHRGLAEAPAALVRPQMAVLDQPGAVLDQPGIEISLQLADAAVDLLAERDTIELIQYSAMEALTDSVRLRALGLGAAVVDVLDGEVDSYSWLSLPQNSVPRSVSTRHRRMPCSSQNGTTGR